MRNERGAITFGPVIGVIVIVLAIIGLFAVCTEDDDDLESHRVEWVSHDHDDGYEDDGWGRGSDGNSGGEYEGGRGGDNDQRGDGNCRNFCVYGVPMPGEGGR